MCTLILFKKMLQPSTSIINYRLIFLKQKMILSECLTRL